MPCTQAREVFYSLHPHHHWRSDRIALTLKMLYWDSRPSRAERVQHSRCRLPRLRGHLFPNKTDLSTRCQLPKSLRAVKSSLTGRLTPMKKPLCLTSRAFRLVSSLDSLNMWTLSRHLPSRVSAMTRLSTRTKLSSQAYSSEINEVPSMEASVAVTDQSIKRQTP